MKPRLHPLFPPIFGERENVLFKGGRYYRDTSVFSGDLQLTRAHLVELCRSKVGHSSDATRLRIGRDSIPTILVFSSSLGLRRVKHDCKDSGRYLE